MAAVFASAKNKFAILGAGRLGQATAAHFSMNGFEVALWDNDTQVIESIIAKNKKISVSGTVEGEGEIYLVSTDLGEVVESSETIIICAHSSMQEEIAKSLCPYVKPWMHIILHPGETFGALAVRQVLDVHDASYTQITVSETSSALFTCNLIEDGHCEITAVKTNIAFATIPASRTAEVLEKFKPFYTQFRPVASVLETSLNNMHAVPNPTVAIMNAARVEAGQTFKIFREGVTPAVASVMEMVDLERQAICRAAGVSSVPLSTYLHEVYDLPLERLDRMYRDSEAYNGVSSGDFIKFICDDISTGLMPMASLGKLLKVNTPTMDALLQMGVAAFPKLKQRVVSGKNVRTVLSVGLSRVEGTRKLNQYLLTGERDDFGKTQVLICGGGNSAHVLCGLLASNEDVVVNIYTTWKNEAERWESSLAGNGEIKVVAPNGRTTKGRPRKVSANAADVATGSQVVFLALPAYAHKKALQEVMPHLPEGCWVGAAPGCPAFDWEAEQVVQTDTGKYTLFNMHSSPWTSRISKYAQEVQIKGYKAEVSVGTVPSTMAEAVAEKLNLWLSPVQLRPVANALNASLIPDSAVFNTGLMYGRYKEWNGEFYEEMPLFYHAATNEEIEIIEKLSDECKMLKEKLEVELEMDLSCVMPARELLAHQYPADIEDSTTTRSCFLSNRAFTGIKTPMRYSPSHGFTPDFDSRYFVEDVPFGLVVTKGIAEIAGLETPCIDAVLEWCQDKLGKEYIVGGKLLGKDIMETRAPARFGITDIDSLRRKMTHDLHFMPKWKNL
mmetsp:Transcript_25208/g.32885  ORF Transcript_25208/g.32885 Transcript_25208/m.32885 type:complete len:785 (+) Transcript_25208:253-2607(+)